MAVNTPKKIPITLCLLLLSISSFSQFDSISARYDSKSTIDKIIKGYTQLELHKLNASTRVLYREPITQTRDYQLALLNQGHLINNDSLEFLLDSIMQRLIRTNELNVDPKILITDEPFANATAYINNIFLFSIGLIASAETLDELAFVVAHELVHSEKYHAADLVYQYYESGFEDAQNDEIMRILSGRSSLQGMENAQKILYELSELRRLNEIEADSLGLQYLVKAGYEPSIAASMLPKLGYRFLGSKAFGPRLMIRLFPENYNVNPGWFADRSEVFEKQPETVLFYKTDSIVSHPDLDERIYRIDSTLKFDSTEYYINPIVFYELVEASYTSDYLDVCLYLSLVGLYKYSYDEFMVSKISEILIKLYNAKYDHTPENHFYKYVSPYTIEYGEDLEMVNTFLNNLSKENLLDIGYHFLNNSKTFSPTNEKHYLLLKEYCEILEKSEVLEKVSALYRQNFPDGKYLKEF